MSRSLSPTTVAASGGDGVPTEGSKKLQDKLHLLLNKLAQSMTIISEWPDEDGDDSTPHTETTSKLTNSVLEIVDALKDVEGTIKTDALLRKSLQECQVPVNLLDLLDHGNGLNPDCFSRGLLREALGQLAGLRRRKKALEMLGAAVQAGLDQKDAAAAAAANQKKRKNDPSTSTTTGADDVTDDNVDGSEQPPPAKKVKVS
mmetsp:Transcript_33982/g.81674  ORF Transcript_33982/g.81674 Transcript_33982/m.81674 type:complete len:202 (-) Transcript_33982:107-712(-)